MFFLTILMIISMLFEILTLNSLFILLTYMTNPMSINNSQIFIYLKNLQLNFDISLLIVIFFICIFTLKTVINIFLSWKESKFLLFTRAELSHTYFKGYLYLPSIFHLRSNTSDLIKNITMEVDMFAVALKAVVVIVMETIVLLGLSTFLLFINFKITILSIISLVLFSLIISSFNTKKILSLGKRRVKVAQLRLKSIIEGLSGSKVFELTGSQKNLIKDFGAFNNTFAKIAHNVSFRGDLPRPLFEVFVLFIIGSIFAYNFNTQDNYKDIIPILGVFVTAAYRLIPSFGKILMYLQKFQFSIQAAENLSKDKEKFNIQNTIVENRVTKFDFRQDINFENVGFSYSDNVKLDANFVLKDVNLKIKKGSKIGIIGGSGSGKSTFLDLVMGLISPQNGKILIDGNKNSRC